MSRTSQTTEDIERELAELGEAPPSEDELTWAFEREHDDDAADVAFVSRLSELATPSSASELSLSELASQRVWRNVEQRSGGRPQTRRSSGGGGSRRWLFAAAGLAAAAAVIIVVVVPRAELGSELGEAEQGPSAEQIADLGAQVRAHLAILDDGKSDTARATELANAYQQRLTQRQERGG